MKTQRLSLFLSGLMLSCLGNGLLPLLPIHAIALGASASGAGFAVAIVYLAQTLGALLVGWLNPSARGSRFLVAVACLLPIPALFLLGYVSSLAQLIAGASLVWAGIGVIGAVLNSSVGQVARPERRGQAFGLLFLSMPLGAAFGPAGIGILVERLGFAQAFLWLGSLWLALPLLLRCLSRGATGELEVISATTDGVQSSARLGSAFWLLALALLLAASAASIGRFASALAMHELGFEAGTIGGSMAAGSLLAVPIPYIAGSLSDRLGRRRCLRAAYLLMAASGLSQMIAEQPWQFGLAAGLRSSASHAGAVASASYAADMLPTSMRTRGLALIGAASWLAFVFGYSAGGALWESLGTTRLLWLAADLPLLAFVLSGFCRVRPSANA